MKSQQKLNTGVLRSMFWASLLLVTFATVLPSTAMSQQTLQFTPAYFKKVSSTSDGGYVIIHSVPGLIFYHKYDSNAVFQYGRQFPGNVGGVQANGKVFALLATNNYYVDIAKIDMATGVMQVSKRIQGPTGGQTYFTPGPAQMIATKDSGLVMLLNPQQCMQIANCQSCMLKLDKNLNYQFFTHTQFNAGSGLLPATPYVDENPDGSLVVAQSVYAPPGYPVVMVRYDGNSGAMLGNRSFNNLSGIPAVLGLATNPGRILVGGNLNSDVYLVSVSNDLNTVHWGMLYAGLYGGGSTSEWAFRLGPNGNYYGHLSSKSMSVRPSGSLAWCKSADNGASIGNWIRLRQQHLAATYNPSSGVGRIATIDSLGNGLCSATDLSPAVSAFSMTQPTVNVSNYLGNNFFITSLPPVPLTAFTPSMSLVCSSICTFTANFSWTNSNLTLQFNPTPLGLTTYSWDFGDGGTSNLSNPSHTYAAPGTYNVCLIGVSGCMSDTVCIPVTVTCTPTNAAFTTSLNQLTMTFNNTSTGGAPLTYSWDFGDGQTSTQASPIHTYASPGYYNVCLTASGPCGSSTLCSVVNVACVNTVAAFSSTTNLLLATFTNASIASGTTTFAWDFGDGTGSTVLSPSHTYAAPGTYAVCLITTSPCGADTICQSITLVCPASVAAFTSTSNLLNASFTNSSTGPGTLGYLWDFGDGSTDTATHPNHTYASAGTYTVCLITTSPCGADTICDSLVIQCPPPVAGFSQTTNLLTATFGNTSSFPVGSTFQWDFGDGNTDTVAQPVHGYPQPGTYLACLVVQSPCGADTFCDSITLSCPSLTAGFTAAGIFPLIAFTDMTAGTPTSWAYDFGDGGTSALQNPTHAYANPGTYAVCLTAMDSCTSDTVCLSVDVIVGLEATVQVSANLQPNPASDLVRISWSNAAKDASIKVFSSDGRWVAVLTDKSSPFVLDVASWPQGIYFVELQLDAGRSTHRLLITR